MVDRRRALVLTVVMLGAGAAALWAASLLVWAWRVEPAAGGVVVREQRGAQAEPALVGLAVAALAAVAAVLATGGWLRRVTGALVLAGGAAALAVAWSGLAQPRPRGAGDVGSGRWAGEIDRWWPQAVTAVGLTALAGVLLAAAGALVLMRGHRMPRMGSRYQRHAQQPGPAQRPAGDRALWDALDAGRDPTDH
ncbi:MAG TPA: Trp biosynthesis-associated membrane protein [Pseudonocardiaceae bacterium]|nr:Trp biosynthesis-associated membrane protein [Pseudonocardiaceae bacterium]